MGLIFLILATISSTSLATKPPFRIDTRKASFIRQSPPPNHARTAVALIPRGGAEAAAASEQSSGPLSMVTSAFQDLQTSLLGSVKSDVLLLLLTSAAIPTICNQLSISPILGFIANGILCGPNGLKCVKDVHRTELLADLGVVLFLFEMGIHLDFATLAKMKVDVFGLGLSQFLVTGLVIGLAASTVLGLSTAASVVLGGALALSSSAFVLQLLKDKGQMGTEYGRTSFGVLLLQDLAVVPLLVITPILAGKGDGGIGQAFGEAGVKALIAFSIVAMIGKFFLTPAFNAVAKIQSQNAFVAAMLFTVLGMSFLTEGLGLSNTLGAFLAGILLSETPHRHAVEKEMSPFRGILVGLFFFTVGFEVDLNLIVTKWRPTLAAVSGILVIKAILATLLCLAFGKSQAVSRRAGLVLSQGGEFAFVAFRLARDVGILSVEETKFLLTCVSLTMAVTPFLEDVGAKMAERLEGKSSGKGKVKKA